MPPSLPKPPAALPFHLPVQSPRTMPPISSFHTSPNFDARFPIMPKSPPDARLHLPREPAPISHWRVNLPAPSRMKAENARCAELSAALRNTTSVAGNELTEQKLSIVLSRILRRTGIRKLPVDPESMRNEQVQVADIQLNVSSEDDVRHIALLARRVRDARDGAAYACSRTRF